MCTFAATELREFGAATAHRVFYLADLRSETTAGSRFAISDRHRLNRAGLDEPLLEGRGLLLVPAEEEVLGPLVEQRLQRCHWKRNLHLQGIHERDQE